MYIGPQSHQERGRTGFSRLPWCSPCGLPTYPVLWKHQIYTSCKFGHFHWRFALTIKNYNSIKMSKLNWWYRISSYYIFKWIWNTFRTSRDTSRSFPKQIKEVTFCTSLCNSMAPATRGPGSAETGTSHRASHNDENAKSYHHNCCLRHLRIWRTAAFSD